MSQLLLNAAIEIAQGAGKILAEAFGQAKQVSHKGTFDVVTSADHASEAYIIDALKKRFPDHGIIAEESGAARETQNIRWVIDPLDGTVNFAHGVPHFCVLIAAEQLNAAGTHYEPIAGVTLDPIRQDLYTARRGGGAFRNDQPLHVSNTSDLVNSLLASGFGYERLFQMQDNHAEFCRLNLLSQGVRRFGAAGLDLAYVASGHFDGYWEYNLNAWDLTPGILLVQEAGGKVTGMDGSPFYSGGGSVVVSNGVIHPAFCAAIQSARDVPVNSREGIGEHLPPAVAAKLQKLGQYLHP